MKRLGRYLEKRRARYERKVREARRRLRPTEEDLDRARLAATHPPRLTPGEYVKRSRRTLAVTFILVGGAWLVYMAAKHLFHLFLTKWFMSVTMIFGSFIAGATSEGGGAVAFPVMTLMFKISPECARNFSLAIQSVGMTAAAFAIWRCKIPVERNAILFSSVGGAVGIVLGTFFVVPLFSNPAFTKMFFTSLWLSFAGALYLINRDRDREIFYSIIDFKPLRAGLVLAVVGVLGGVVSSLTGSGLDILTFSLLTLRYRVSESVATPTSVVLMAFNSIIGFSTHLFLVPMPVTGGPYLMGDFQIEAFHFWLVCIPIVILGAPAGARFIRNRSRLFVAWLLYLTIFTQFIASLLILKPAGWLLLFSTLVLLLGLGLFGFLALSGKNRIDLKMPLFQEPDHLRSLSEQV